MMNLVYARSVNGGTPHTEVGPETATSAESGESETLGASATIENLKGDELLTASRGIFHYEAIRIIRSDLQRGPDCLLFAKKWIIHLTHHLEDVTFRDVPSSGYGKRGVQ